MDQVAGRGGQLLLVLQIALPITGLLPSRVALRVAGMRQRVRAAGAGDTRTAATAAVRCGRVFVAGAMLEGGAGRRRILLVWIQGLVHLRGADVTPHFHELENVGGWGGGVEWVLCLRAE